MVRTAQEDRVFQSRLERVGDFKFDDEVAGVFDDMVSRSVPSYAEIQRLLVELGTYFATEGSNVYDLGCSTGTTLALLHNSLHVNARLCGVDSSEEMLHKCRDKLEGLGLKDAIALQCADLEIGRASCRERVYACV